MNFANADFGAKIISSSSEVPGCSAEHVLEEDLSKIWLSEEGIPQWLCVSLQDSSNVTSLEIRTVGWYCWHSYSTNPREVRLHVSRDGAKFRIWDTMTADRQRAGTQLFCIEPISASLYPFIAFEIMSTFGGSQTYVNQLYLFSEEVSNSFVLSTSVDADDNDLRELEEDNEREMSDDSLLQGPDVTQRLEEALGISDDVTLSSLDSFSDDDQVQHSAPRPAMTFPVYAEARPPDVIAADSVTSLGLLAISSAALHSSSPLPPISVDCLKDVAAMTHSGSVTSAVAKEKADVAADVRLEERFKELEEWFLHLLASRNSNPNLPSEVVREVVTSVDRLHSQEVQTDVSLLLPEVTSSPPSEAKDNHEEEADVIAPPSPSKPPHHYHLSSRQSESLPHMTSAPLEEVLTPHTMTSLPLSATFLPSHTSLGGVTSSLYSSVRGGAGRERDHAFALTSPSLRLQHLLRASERESSAEVTSREIRETVMRDSVRRAVRQHALHTLTGTYTHGNSVSNRDSSSDDVDLDRLVRELHEAVSQKTVKEAQLKMLQSLRHSHSHH